MSVCLCQERVGRVRAYMNIRVRQAARGVLLQAGTQCNGLSHQCTTHVDQHLGLPLWR